MVDSRTVSFPTPASSGTADSPAGAGNSPAGAAVVSSPTGTSTPQSTPLPSRRAGQPVRSQTTPLEIHDLGTVDYAEAFDLQHDLAARRATGEIRDQLLLLEHPFTYTAGRRTEDSDRPTDGSPVVDVDRGGRITWHGPGQLVGYPIVKLLEPLDVVDYVRRIEEALIHVVTDFGIPAGRVDGRSGVWVPADPARAQPARKIAALGIRVSRGVTLHGFALNCDCDLSGFARITPCGIADAGVTSLTAELDRTVTVGEVHDAVCTAVTSALDGTLPLTDHKLSPQR